ncbi:MAG: DNA alkylation repair protein [Candidatus Marinimicrobia bacterium]|nr:DNA alkylation repair protein [Candidatus Neomarinimicrobiota bacterium]
MPKDISVALRAFADKSDAIATQRFFKTGPGEYGEGDRFLGVRVPAIRLVAKEYRALPMADAVTLLQSAFHEERLLALIILTQKFRAGDAAVRAIIYRTYLNHTRYTNDLIHKAVGWMLREVGNRDRSKEDAFLMTHYRYMPRTDVLYEGPRCPGWPNEATIIARAAFLEEATAGGLDRSRVLKTLRCQYAKLSEAAPTVLGRHNSLGQD